MKLLKEESLPTVTDQINHMKKKVEDNMLFVQKQFKEIENYNIYINHQL
jgi:hypothetical protein